MMLEHFPVSLQEKELLWGTEKPPISPPHLKMYNAVWWIWEYLI